MKKSTLLAAAVAATLVSAPSFAAYISSANLSGSVSVTGYNPLFDDDQDAGTYVVTLYDLVGSVSTQLPPPGNYNVSIDGSAVIDISDNPLIDPIAITPNNLGIFSGLVDIFNVINPNQTFDFLDAGTIGTLDTQLSPDDAITFGLNYDGETTDAVMNFINGLRLLAGLSPVVDPSGSGSLNVTGTLYSDGVVLKVEEIATDWPGFGGALVEVDNIMYPNTQIPVFGSPNFVDASFEVDVTATARFIPEPTSLALLGLGLAGLVASRRRRAA